MLLIGLGQKLIPEKGIGKMVIVTMMARKASKITGIRNLSTRPGDSKPGSSQSGNTRSGISIPEKLKAAKDDHKTDAGRDDNRDGDTSRDSEVAAGRRTAHAD